MYLTTKEIENEDKVRNSIGGYPVVPEGYEWPICPVSKERMVLFLQLDLPGELGLGNNRHISIFMSPKINEIPTFDFIPPGERLSECFWEKRENHFKTYYFEGEGTTLNNPDPYLGNKELVPSEDVNGIKVGGEPDWLQDPEFPTGPNGEEFKFVLQVPDGYAFPKLKEAPEQPDSFSSKDYCLFLGNQVYIFVSNEISHPEAVWIVVQN